MVAVPAGDVQNVDMSFSANLQLVRDACSIDIIYARLDERERAAVEVRKLGAGVTKVVCAKPCRERT